jgi:hypothetical protein
MPIDPEDWPSEIERAQGDHDPAREPYASMTREEVFDLMQAEGLSAYDYERLHQHFLDKCSKADLTRINFTEKLTSWIMDELETFGNDQAKYCHEVAIEASNRLFLGMPAPGPIHEIN